MVLEHANMNLCLISLQCLFSFCFMENYGIILMDYENGLRWILLPERTNISCQNYKNVAAELTIWFFTLNIYSNENH